MKKGKKKIGRKAKKNLMFIEEQENAIRWKGSKKKEEKKQ